MGIFARYTAAFTRKKVLENAVITDTQLRRCLTTIDLTFIGIGSTLGAGIYVLTGEVAKNKAGPAIILSFLVAAIASILSGLCYAEFGARVPKAGSAYLYCYITIGELLGYFVGWNLILEYLIGASSITRALSAYIDVLAGGAIHNGTISLIGELHTPFLASYFDLFSIFINIVITILLSLGVKNSARFNNVCVATNMITILAVIIVGFVYAEPKNWSNFAPYGARGVFAGAATCFFSYIGFDVIATTSEEAKNPAKSIPISMTGTIVFCFLAYVGVSGAVTLMVPYTQLSETAAVVDAFHQRGLKFMGTIIGVGACLGLIGCNIISMMPLPRLLYALSQDGLLPKCFSIVNTKTEVPVMATITAGIFTALVAALLDLDSLVEMLSIGTLLAYSVVDICILLLRYKDTESEESNKNRNLYIAMVITIFQLFGINTILSKYWHHLSEKNHILIAALMIITFTFVLTCIYFTRLKPNITHFSFQVPLLPWIPLVGLFFNTYLMLSLSELTMYRFLVWMVIGILVYFAYSMNHSVEREQPQVKDNERQPLIHGQCTAFNGSDEESVASNQKDELKRD